jgi:hypothetical protein
VEAPVNKLTRDRDPALAEELLEQVPVAQLLLQATPVVEGVQPDVGLVIPREDFGHQEAIGEVPVQGSSSSEALRVSTCACGAAPTAPARSARSDPNRMLTCEGS